MNADKRRFKMNDQEFKNSHICVNLRFQRYFHIPIPPDGNTAIRQSGQPSEIHPGLLRTVIIGTGRGEKILFGGNAREMPIGVGRMTAGNYFNRLTAAFAEFAE